LKKAGLAPRGMIVVQTEISNEMKEFKGVFLSPGKLIV
jgi:hypothetical protein